MEEGCLNPSKVNELFLYNNTALNLEGIQCNQILYCIWSDLSKHFVILHTVHFGRIIKSDISFNPLTKVLSILFFFNLSSAEYDDWNQFNMALRVRIDKLFKKPATGRKTD